MKLSREKWIPLIVTLLMVFMIFFIAKFLPSEDLLIGTDEIASLDKNWTINIEDKEYSDSVLPFKESVKPGTLYFATHQLKDAFNAPMTLRIRSSMQSIAVYLEDVLIFENRESNDFSCFFHVPEASTWSLIKLPANSAGKMLKLELKSEISNFSGVINPIFYGSGEALTLDIIRSQNIGTLIGIILLGISLISFGLFFFLPSISDSRMLFLALFAGSTGIWFLSEMKVLQLLIGNRFIIGGISYLMLSVIPISFCFYLKYAVLVRYKKVMNLFSILFAVLFVVNIILQLFGIMPFIKSIVFNNIMLLLIMGATVILLIVEAIKFRNLQAKKFVLYISILVIVVSFEIIQFLGQNFDVISYLSRFGIVIFFLFLLMDTSKYISMLIERKKESEIFERLAYMDILTGAGNRTAFEKEIHERMRDAHDQNYRLALFDINYLKRINDNYGHKAGDLAIIKSYTCINEAFYDAGICYRLGGDEFACVLSTMEDSEFEKRIIRMSERLVSESTELPFNLSVSSGSLEYSAIYASDFDKFFDKVDQQLYKNKNASKEAT